jgi:hypothetical protein
LSSETKTTGEDDTKRMLGMQAVSDNSDQDSSTRLSSNKSNRRPLSCVEDGVELHVLTPASFLFQRPNQLPEAQPHNEENRNSPKETEVPKKLQRTSCGIGGDENI